MSGSKMRIALDAMGSDNYPTPDVAGAVLAAGEWPVQIALVGDEVRLRTELAKHDTHNLDLRIVHAAEAVTMDDKPSLVVRQKKQSSMHVAMQLVKDGEADAFVTAGNTGAVLAIAMLGVLKRIKGVQRPALAVRFPTPGLPLLIDGGANADCKPDYLLQFGHMGSVYMQNAAGIERPRVGIISNGEEEGKGNQLVRDAAELLAGADLNFVGSIEPKEFVQGAADVAVCDGFTGNIMLKTAEATAGMLTGMIREQLLASARTKIGALLSKPAFDQVRARLAPETTGGALLLGVNGLVVIGHGRSDHMAIKNAIGQARRAVEGDVLGKMLQIDW